MKLLYVEKAKVIWQFDLRLLNPGGLAIASLLTGINERYKFASAPTHPLDTATQGGLSFTEGIFKTSKGVELGVSVTIHKDGIAADSFSNTEYTIEFLRDLALFSAGLGFPWPAENQIGKAYTSVLGVSCNVPLAALNPRLTSITRLIESKLLTLDGKPRTMEVAGITIFSEDLNPHSAPTLFRFERKVRQPFAANCYTAQAPLQTDDHIEVLVELERILLS